MSSTQPVSAYVLGNTEAEHERLARQAAVYNPLTERLFREAGIGPGQRVLDLGSGAGDVAMLVARVVGPKGEVVGIDRSADSIAWARDRAAKAALHNITFLQADAGDVAKQKPFDAAVGRWILMFVPDPAAVLRSVAKLVRPGGALAFHEPCWDPLLKRTEGLPLCTATLSLLQATINKSGGNTDLGFSLRKVFLDAGLPEPTMRMETPVGDHHAMANWVADTLKSVTRSIDPKDPALAQVGDFDSLGARLEAEIDASSRTLAWLSLVGAWTKVPASVTR